jgi:Zn-dependent peptidase ImmA (M78 family)/DNA-binding XRE family transcriptional regulator
MKAFVQPNMISWARSRSDFSVEDVAKKLHVKAEKVAAWECGEDAPTLCQARNLAKAMHIPLGWLYLKTPPEEKVLIPDLRTIRNSGSAGLSPDFRDQLNEVLYKQQQYVELIMEDGAEPLPFVGKFSGKDNPMAIVADIRDALGINHEMRQAAANWEDFLREFILRAESLGILVMRSGIVGNNPHRPLSVQEFRGFAISDVYAPLIFINGKDAKAAQIFTLAHELAHLWIGESGISNQAMNDSGIRPKQIEVFCNQIAAELLVPAAELTGRWQKANEPAANIHALSCYFRVSGLVVMYRALDLSFITRSEFDELYRIEMARHAARVKSTEGGPPPQITIPARNSHLLTETILSAAYEGKLLFRDACRILGTTMTTLDKLASMAGVM